MRRYRNSIILFKFIVPVWALFFVSGCSHWQRTEAADPIRVLERLIAADRKVDNFCSRVSFAMYDTHGRLLEDEQVGYRLYAMPDKSLICIPGAKGWQRAYAEVGTMVRDKQGSSLHTSTLPDSYFVRDFRSMLATPLRVPSGRGASANESERPRFTIEPGQQTTNGGQDVYSLSMSSPGYENAVLRMDVNAGTLLEKTVHSLPGNQVTSHEVDSNFIMVDGVYLPTQTIYEYGGRTTVLHLWDYQINVPVAQSIFMLEGDSCDKLASWYDREKEQKIGRGSTR